MNRIAELRKAAGLSQIELSKILSIPQNTLSQYENEMRRPSVNNVKKLSEYFNVTPNYLLGIPEPAKMDDSNFSLLKVSRVKQFTTEDHVNMYLNLGWKLLYVGQYMNIPDCGRGGDAEIVYSLGWFGDPKNVADDLVLGEYEEERDLW